ncbi:MAG: 16S rRNA (adenine(1518)-N(6)/adenine(1519)-N(6))-dimethyltransferase RsmA [Thaumarchaeota archaeon]|nr:16S rRNA (adenine(1518)-N(6)/adenine(1519)-N(6))-dimethyltransferase RsmA [Nitrososphaerota archaeon]
MNTRPPLSRRKYDRRRKSLGQHMLASSLIAEQIVAQAAIRSSDIVLEIGTGSGMLTELLAKQARSVKSYEIDPTLVEVARSRLTAYCNVELIAGDAFAEKLPIEFDVCVTSLPYSQSLRFLKWAALSSSKVKRFLAVVQSEFADKLLAIPGTHSYRAASVIAQLSFDVEKLFVIPRSEFLPHPRVTSRLIRLTSKLVNRSPFFTESRMEKLNRLFSYRSKTLGSALRRMLPKSAQIPLSNSLFGERVESLSPSQFKEVILSLEEMQDEK